MRELGRKGRGRSVWCMDWGQCWMREAWRLNNSRNGAGIWKSGIVVIA